MKLRFWGTRGSLAKPGPDTVRYGGNTSCIQLESKAGTLLLLDCGTGAHGLGQFLLSRPGPLRGHILISHTHWDHIQGIPFFAPLFVPGNRWDFYAAQGFGESLRETLAGQMEYTYFPVTLDALNAEVHYHNLVEGRFEIGDIVVHTAYLNHPALTLGFRIEVDGVVIVYSCDHEPHSRELALGPVEITGQDLHHAEFLRDADLVIHDAQYTAEEYPKKVGWGHSTVNYAVHLCRSVGVQRLALTHHDPMRNDLALDALMQQIQAGLREQNASIEVFAAAEGMEIELYADPGSLPRHKGGVESSALREVAAEDRRPILLGIQEPKLAAQLASAVQADGAQLLQCEDGATTLALCAQHMPALVIVEAQLPDLSAAEICRQIRAGGDEYARHVPIVRLCRGPEQLESHDGDFSDQLLAPFSVEYARTRIRTWAMRTLARWQRPPVPANENERLAALKALGILDTAPEERFNRFTRLAAALFEVPVVLISLVDERRQWFKSCYGADETEGPREISFCAHALGSRDLMIVPDAVLDARFADNPTVAAGPRIRFYAGYPLHLPNGFCLGTLCLIDQRPRQLSREQQQLLRDLGSMVEQELADYQA